MDSSLTLIPYACDWRQKNNVAFIIFFLVVLSSMHMTEGKLNSAPLMHSSLVHLENEEAAMIFLLCNLSYSSFSTSSEAFQRQYR